MKQAAIIGKYRNVFFKPIKEELALFVFSFFLLVPRTLFVLLTRPARWFNDWNQYPSLRFLSIALVISYIVALSACLIKRGLFRILYKGSVYAILYLLFFVNIFMAINYRAALSPNTLLLILETTPYEIRDFLSTYGVTTKSVAVYLSVMAIVYANIYFEMNKNRINVMIEKKMRSVFRTVASISFISLFLCGLYSFRIYPQLFKINTIEDIDFWNPGGDASMDFVTGLIYSIYDLKLVGKTLVLAEQNTIDVSSANQSLLWNGDSCNVVLVIGESFAKNHSSLYGYSLKTNPKLEREMHKGQLVAFTDVIAPGAYTSYSIRNMMSCNSIGNGEQWYEMPYFPIIFKNAGYDVYMWDNQYKVTSNAGYDFSLNSYLFSPTVASSTYTAWCGYQSNYDREIVDSFEDYKEENPLGNRNLVIFHLQGQHFKQENKYPQQKEFQRFTIDDIKRPEIWMSKEIKQIIAHYDNCTFYNDSVISSVISLFANTASVLVYFSDHGEDVYDTGYFYGRRRHLAPSDTLLIRQLYEIPFVIWLSNKYIEQHPDICSEIVKAKGKPFMVDNLCHLLFNIGGVVSDYYNKSRDVMSDDYQCPPRILDNGLDYDDICNHQKSCKE